MGKRSRRRGPLAITEPHAPTAAQATPRPPAASRHARTKDRRARLDEAPKAPWAPVPLTEGAILLGMILLLAGIAIADKRAVLILCGAVLVCLAGLEVAVREHFAAYRSHSALLGLLAAVPVLVLSDLAGLWRPAAAGLAIIAFGTAAWAARGAFARRAGGIGFRV